MLSLVTRSNQPCDPTSSSTLFLPVSHDALQELREIHSRQQRQKQKELDGDAHTHIQTQLERKSAELQEHR